MQLYFIENTGKTLPDSSALSATGDLRFNGSAVMDFLHTRYQVVAEGTEYTTTVDSSYATLPLYDKYKQQVFFPITTINNTILDANKKNIYLPLTDLNGRAVSLPLKDKENNTVNSPVSLESVITAETAYKEIDKAYSNAKDAHAFNFVQYLYALSKDNKISFFYGTVTTSENKNINFFAAGVFDSSSSETDVTDITSEKLKYFIKYYPDRKDLTYSLYTEKYSSSITNIYTTVASDTKDINNIIQAEQNFSIASKIAASTAWDSKINPAIYQKNIISTNTINQAIKTLNNNLISMQEEIASLKSALSSS